MDDVIISFWLDLMHDEEAKPQDRLKASELLAKALGMFNDKAPKEDVTIRLVTDKVNSG